MLNSSFCLPVLIVCLLSGCATPRQQETFNTTHSAQLGTDAAVMPDGYRLPLATWSPSGRPRAILLGLHGFNDYRNAFRAAAGYFRAHGIMTVAYDQRGFGETAQRGLWAGAGNMRDDARRVAALLCERYPDTPLYLLGESMGGAVAMLAVDGMPQTCIRGAVLTAPAVWGWETMPWWQAAALRLLAHTLPGKTVTGENLDIMASDNIEMLRALARDPLVIKATRIDTLYGLTGLMQDAFDVSPRMTHQLLFLYGERDEIIPRHAVCRMLYKLPDDNTRHWHIGLYPQGYHMLTRDLQAETVLQDIVAWLSAADAQPPGGQVALHAAPSTVALCGHSD